jgi:hypothetical protein
VSGVSSQRALWKPLTMVVVALVVFGLREELLTLVAQNAYAIVVVRLNSPSPIGTPPAPGPAVERAYLAGVRAEHDGDVPLALELYGVARAARPDLAGWQVARLRLDQGRLAAKSQDWALAATFARAATVAYPPSQAAWVLSAQGEYVSGQGAARAMSAINVAIGLDRRYPPPYALAAHISLDARDVAAASCWLSTFQSVGGDAPTVKSLTTRMLSLERQLNVVPIQGAPVCP